MTPWPGAVLPGPADTIEVPDDALDAPFEALAWLGVTFQGTVPTQFAKMLLHELKV